jgi:hypothetical protein
MGRDIVRLADKMLELTREELAGKLRLAALLTVVLELCENVQGYNGC